MRLVWRGKQLTEYIVADMRMAVGEIGLAIEQGAKGDLYPLHGYNTGSLKRSIHTAKPGHSFKGEHRYPDGPERGGRLVPGERGTDGNPQIAVGTGQDYAHYVHWRFPFFEAGLLRAKIMLPSILRRYRR